VSPKTLLLLRHATAEPSRPGHRDLDRRLSADGLAEARGVGEDLRAQGVRVDHVLCSAAVRTRQTLEQLRLTGRPRVDVRLDLYLGGTADILELVSSVVASTLLVVGHAPSVPGAVHELADPQASAAAALAAVTDRFPPATLARLDLPAGAGPGAGVLVEVRLPDSARGLYHR
jgi:phosphohistidine phosphatase